MEKYKYLVTKQRSPGGIGPSSLAVLAHYPDVEILRDSDPDMVLINATELTAARLQKELAKTHYVEREIRRYEH